jgi:hypothetical protein
MGREIRRVPPDWEHPRYTDADRYTHRGRVYPGEYKPLYDRDFETEAREWMDSAIAWDNGTHPDAPEEKAGHPFYWQWDGEPPDPNYYRPKFPEGAATAYQMYENVSEGTPVSPVFATLEEMEAWLIGAGHSPEAAAKFCRTGWAPSMVIFNGDIRSGVDAFDVIPTPAPTGAQNAQGAEEK